MYTITPPHSGPEPQKHTGIIVESTHNDMDSILVKLKKLIQNRLSISIEGISQRWHSWTVHLGTVSPSNNIIVILSQDSQNQNHKDNHAELDRDGEFVMSDTEKSPSFQEEDLDEFKYQCERIANYLFRPGQEYSRQFSFDPSLMDQYESLKDLSHECCESACLYEILHKNSVV